MRRFAVRGPLIVPEQYDAANSITQFAATYTQSAPAHTVFAQVRYGVGEAAAGGYIFTTLETSTSRNGIVLRQRNDNHRVSFLADSTGGINTPSKTGTVASSVGDIVAWGATWDKTSAGAGINIYYANADAKMALDTPSLSADGSGSTDFSAVQGTPVVGNNQPGTRASGSAIFRTIHWGSIVPPEAMDEVRRGWPAALFGPVLLDFYNGYDHGPFGSQVVIRTNIAYGAPSPLIYPPRVLVRSHRREGVAGGTVFNADMVEGSATAVDSPSATLITPQLTYPVADIALNGWLPSSGSTLYPMLDETAADFADFIYSPGNPTTQQFEVKLGALGDPVSSVNHGVQIALQAIGFDTNFDFNLVQGSTILDSWTELVTVAQGQVTRTRNFSGAVADSITDYSDLRIRGVARA